MSVPPSRFRKGAASSLMVWCWRSGGASRLMVSALRPRDDLVDHRRLGVRVVLGIGPVLLGQRALGLLVTLPVVGMATEPIAEEHHAGDLLAALREHMQI